MTLRAEYEYLKAQSDGTMAYSIVGLYENRFAEMKREKELTELFDKIEVRKKKRIKPCNLTY